MVNPEVASAVLCGGPVAVGAAVYTTSAVRYVRSSKERKAAIRRAWIVRRRWKKTAMRVGLYQTDKATRVGEIGPSTATSQKAPRVLLPTLRVRSDEYGLIIDVKTVGKLGLDAWQKAAPNLADEWLVQAVTVEATKPGWLRVRGMLRDPLTEPMDFNRPDASAVDLKSWHVGRDSYGTQVTLRSEGVSGAVVAGLAGYGKTKLLNARISQLAVSGAVQFVFIDGKGGPDYDDLFCRAYMFCKDDLTEARDILRQLHKLMVERQASISSVLGVKNMWHVGPSVAWPLVMLVIDEAHTFFYEYKGKGNEARAALVAEITRLVEELVRKGRNVGIQVVLATQKATGDAIPTRIRDNCQVAMSFAQRTSEAAVAVLGADISEYPEAHPRRLQDPAYIGVASMQVEGRPGYTLVRTPLATDELTAEIAAATAHLTCDPLRLLEAALTVEPLQLAA